MITKKILIALVVTFLLGLGLTWFRKSSSEDTLILGTMSGWPPFVSLNEEGSYEGLDIDIASIIAKHLNKKLVIKDMETALLITALDQGQVDFVMTGLDMTPQRIKRMTMIPYQGEPITSLPLLFWKKKPDNVSSFNDLKKLPQATICVESGSSQEEILSQYGGFAIKNVEPLVALLELQTGRATAVLLDDKMVKTFKEKEPNLVSIDIPLKESEIIQGCGIGIKKSNRNLILQITAIIKELKQSGTLSQLETKWIPKIKGKL